MKKPIILFIVTVALSVSASANNLDQGGELSVQKKEQSTCSINGSFLSLFTLFSVEPAKPDSVKTITRPKLDLHRAEKD